MSLTTTSAGSLSTSSFSPSVLKVKRLASDAKLPIRSTQGAAGYDLFSSENVRILPGEKQCIGTSISIELPSNHVGLIKSRSGLSVKFDLEVGAGVIDPDYRGEVRVVLRNLGKMPYEVKQGDKIAQMVIQEFFRGEVVETTLDSTERGEKGFGSTG